VELIKSEFQSCKGIQKCGGCVGNRRVISQGSREWMNGDDCFT